MSDFQELVFRNGEAKMTCQSHAAVFVERNALEPFGQFRFEYVRTWLIADGQSDFTVPDNHRQFALRTCKGEPKSALANEQRAERQRCENLGKFSLCLGNEPTCA